MGRWGDGAMYYEVDAMTAITRYASAATASIALAAACALAPAQSCSARERPLLNGMVISSSGLSLAGIPIEAHRANSNITVVVYTDARGEYSFPDWSDV